MTRDEKALAEIERLTAANAEQVRVIEDLKRKKLAVMQESAQLQAVKRTAKAHAEYKDITDPKAREQYRKDHAVELGLK